MVVANLMVKFQNYMHSSCECGGEFSELYVQ